MYVGRSVPLATGTFVPTLPALYAIFTDLAPQARLLNPVQSALAQLVVDGSAPPAQLSTQVRAVAAQMGHSLENALAQQAGALPSTPGAPPSLLPRLAELRPYLQWLRRAQAGLHRCHTLRASNDKPITTPNS